MRQPLALLAAGLLLGCATTAPGGPLTGSWGGEHVGLTLDPGGGRLDYDCAAGTIDEPLVAVHDGSFAANGRHTPGMGGPEQIDRPRPSYPARYTGTVGRGTMTLRVWIPSQNLTLGPYRLRRDIRPQLLRCL
jgi:hypothetical protein